MTLILLLCSAAAVAAAVPQYYHDSVGVPMAARIRLAEENAVIGQRIVGGSQAMLGSHPYMGGLVIFLTSGQTSVCGSTLLTNTRLVTVAQCWWDGRNMGQKLTVVLGSTRLFSGGVRINTSNVEMYSSWNPNDLLNNIAMIKIPSINFTSVIQPVALPSDVQMSNNNFAGLWGTAVGFGRTSDMAGISTSQYLNRVNLQIITNSDCQRSLGNVLVIAGRICTSGASGAPCGGDAGGPLVVNIKNKDVLVGITAYGLWGCENVLPSVFIRVTSFEDWIQDKS